MNANKVFKLLKDDLNVAPNIFVLDVLKPLMRELVVEYNSKKNHKNLVLSDEYRKVVIQKLNDIQTKNQMEQNLI